MKSKYNPSYRSYLATMKRKRSEGLFEWLKELYMKSLFEGKTNPRQIRNIAEGTKPFGTWVGENAQVKSWPCPDA
jgi:hypothetical protein